MTPEERAMSLVERHLEFIADDAKEPLVEDIAAAIRKAVKEEREACAALCDSLEHNCEGLCAKEIRSRS